MTQLCLAGDSHHPFSCNLLSEMHLHLAQMHWYSTERWLGSQKGETDPFMGSSALLCSGAICAPSGSKNLLTAKSWEVAVGKEHPWLAWSFTCFLSHCVPLWHRNPPHSGEWSSPGNMNHPIYVLTLPFLQVFPWGINDLACMLAGRQCSLG